MKYASIMRVTYESAEQGGAETAYLGMRRLSAADLEVLRALDGKDADEQPAAHVGAFERLWDLACREGRPDLPPRGEVDLQCALTFYPYLASE